MAYIRIYPKQIDGMQVVDKRCSGHSKWSKKDVTWFHLGRKEEIKQTRIPGQMSTAPNSMRIPGRSNRRGSMSGQRRQKDNCRETIFGYGPTVGVQTFNRRDIIHLVSPPSSQRTVIFSSELNIIFVSSSSTSYLSRQSINLRRSQGVSSVYPFSTISIYLVMWFNVV